MNDCNNYSLHALFGRNFSILVVGACLASSSRKSGN